MGWSLGDIGLTIGTGGAYGLYKAGNDYTSEQNANQQANNSAMDLYNRGLSSNAAANAANKKYQYYGTSLQNLGGETQDYVSRLQGNLDKNVAKADIYNQEAGQTRAVSNARAGLSNVDTTAMNEQGRRNSAFTAAGINEEAKRNALDLYGKSISNRIEGANQIDNSEMALAIAQMKQPTANYNPGLLGSLFSGFF